MAVALIIPVVLALLVPWLLGMKEELAGFTRSVTATVSQLDSMAARITTQTKRGTELLNKLETRYESVKKRSARRINPRRNMPNSQE